MYVLLAKSSNRPSMQEINQAPEVILCISKFKSSSLKDKYLNSDLPNLKRFRKLYWRKVCFTYEEL